MLGLKNHLPNYYFLEPYLSATMHIYNNSNKHNYICTTTRNYYYDQSSETLPTFRSPHGGFTQGKDYTHKRHTGKKWTYSNLTATECSDGMPNDGDIYNVRGILMTNEKTKCPICAKSSHPALYSLLANV